MVVNSTNGCRRWDRRRSALDVLEWRVASGTKLFGGKMRVVVVVGLVMAERRDRSQFLPPLSKQDRLIQIWLRGRLTDGGGGGYDCEFLHV